MNPLIKNYIVRPISYPIVLAIPAFQGMVHLLAKIIMKIPGYFSLREREFYYHKEQVAHKTAMEIKKNNFPGPGSPL